MKMRTFSRDEIFELLIVRHTDGLSFVEAVSSLLGREATSDDCKAADEKIALMRSGWVAMSRNIRGLGR
jgi:hypothetical protein